MASIRSGIGENMEDRYLFKAKCFEKWHIGNIVKEPDGLYIRDIKENVMAYIDDESTICQCTGLKDKNGKLIWENDILDGFTYPYMSDGVHNYYVEVCWCDNVPSFGIYTQKYPESKVAGISAGMTELMEDWNQNDWEVVGNIFDNKELLESEG